MLQGLIYLFFLKLVLDSFKQQCCDIFHNFKAIWKALQIPIHEYNLHCKTNFQQIQQNTALIYSNNINKKWFAAHEQIYTEANTWVGPEKFHKIRRKTPVPESLSK